ncbi:cobalamin binding intrinsic factor-like isoform X1 [Babylonia areolata]|uniref:cobalamin binding intrinsic factor-like isoform X1 n=1 Tax=Babylonia areolata TaxID=304850 RepID=UPI003FD01280
MASRTYCCLVLCLCAISLCSGKGCKNRRCRFYPTPAELKRCVTCNAFQPKTVTLVVRNILREPTFEDSVKLRCTRSKTLFFMMQEAADVDPAFKFSASYNHAGHPGFFVDAINGLYSQWEVDRTWWEILDGDLNHTPVGVSSYVPKHGETVTFNFTQGGGHQADQDEGATSA